MACPKCKHAVALIAAVLLCCSSVCLAASVRIGYDNLRIKRFHNGGNQIGPTVHHFARHALCRDLAGKIRFYNALADHLCEVSENMKVSLVLDLCERKDHMLDKWVAEVYDSDGDGFISHLERSYFED